MLVDSACCWPLGPEELALSPDVVHVWAAWLDLPSAWRDRLQRTLSKDELERAGRLRFERDRRRYIARRGLLRDLLGRYLGAAAGELRFVYSDQGKPCLAPGFEYRRGSPPAALRFNLSHSAGLALYAFTLERHLGVDIERLGERIHYEQIAERYFSPQERAVLHSLPPESGALAFYLCWTRKEAYVKAHGEGLSLPLEQFDVSLIPGEAAQLLATRGGLEAAELWGMQHLEPAPGYVAALAVKGRGWRLQHWQVASHQLFGQ
ncbi:MAG: 4'-phosphopantetheinyl transferase superfamily protein [Anaerolineales bacterium]|nr:4'-phosphopantetheinyl transferase superfamily protein [Anaerolineales bacterium]